MIYFWFTVLGVSGYFLLKMYHQRMANRAISSANIYLAIIKKLERSDFWFDQTGFILLREERKEINGLRYELIRSLDIFYESRSWESARALRGSVRRLGDYLELHLPEDVLINLGFYDHE